MITCSRCDAQIEESGFPDMTAGYYDCRTGYWHKFALPGETFLCDACMFKDEKYIAVYGHKA
jgi:hypothetical protein